MTKWYAIVKIWNENDHIRDTLEALEGCFDNIHVTDGAWSYYPYGHSKVYDTYQSTDGSLLTVTKIMSRMPEVSLHLVPRPWVSETQKFNFGIKMTEAQPGDYILFLDGHEIMEGDFHKQREIIEEEAWNIGKVVVYDPDNHPPRYHGNEWDRLKLYHSQWRILRYHPTLCVINKHWNFNIYQHGELDKNIPDPVHVCEHIKFQHRKRNPERDRIRDLFKHTISPFRFHEGEYVEWRTQQGLKDGQVIIPT
jgi:hypothetical protein